MSEKIEKDIIEESDYSKYLEELKNYYDIKNRYTLQKESFINKIKKANNSIEAKKKLFSKQKFKCIKCGKDGGTIFIENDKMLRATCGNVENPCGLNIEVVKMISIQIDKELEAANYLLINTKREIILTKLDFLFNYIEEDIAVEKFDNLKNILNEYQEKYNELYFMYRDIVNNKENNKVLNEKLLEHSNLVNEYKEYLELFKKTGDRNFIKEAVGLYISKIKDLDRNIMNLKYKHNFVEEIEEVEEIENNNIIRLVQEKYNLKDLELIKKPKTQ